MQITRRLGGNAYGGTYHFANPKRKKINLDPKYVTYASMTKEWNPSFPNELHEAEPEAVAMLAHLRRPLPIFLKKNVYSDLFVVYRLLILLGELLGL